MFYANKIKTSQEDLKKKITPLCLAQLNLPRTDPSVGAEVGEKNFVIFVSLF